VFTQSITADNGFWYRGTADSIWQNISFLKNSHEPYVIIASGDGVYKLDFNKVLDYHIAKKADVTIVTKELDSEVDVSRFGVVKIDDDGRIIDFVEKPVQADSNTVSTGIYVIRRRLLIELIERCAEEERYDIVNDILIRYKNIKRIYSYPLTTFWSSVSSVNSYFNTNMEFLKPEVRNYFFKQYPDVYSKVDDLPPAKFNPGSYVRNSLISSGCIINGTVENSVLFKKAYIGNNCVIKNSIILNNVYIGDNTYIENCIVESRDTIRANSNYVGEPGKPMVVMELSERYTI
jgi:glucose-1-phosphate adenylyltransferase